ncbi:DUF1538 domain-containing protein [Lentibacillus amyloliquefaciens]|uniref:DUF1538 domain-containing protein n=1 Tax=Lentibacillus amyloliquefaciens TaxID=1472767 RepID=A0A0U3W9F3_9BACI|nr:DUF1538 domain-containing protein [Lentibacillus amyloliquefaciens]ALX49666.1 hypothetical protein AOX59_14470 [Lentibacillus amyloliquefaciens]
MNLVIFEGFGATMQEVAIALLPLAILFAVFHFLFLKLPLKRLIGISIGFVLAFLGLSLFLQGVHIGFMPFGEQMGNVLGGLSSKWLLIPIGFIIGFFAIYAEPAVAVMVEQAEKVSGGYIPEKLLLYTLSIGVGVSVALSMVRLIFGFSLWYFIIPGYIIAFVMTRYAPKAFMTIAFDSGGVSTGPMTATFVLAMFTGIAGQIEGRDPLVDGFGMVAMVALAPILSVLTLGILYSRKEKSQYVSDDSGAEAHHHDR